MASTAGQSSRTSSQGNVANNELMVKLNRIRVQQHSDLFRPTAELASGEAKPITEIDYRKLYFELMKQYKQIETLLASENTLTQQTSGEHSFHTINWVVDYFCFVCRNYNQSFGCRRKEWFE